MTSVDNDPSAPVDAAPATPEDADAPMIPGLIIQ